MILKWLTPIGLLGLLGLIALVLIYILKPQFREKKISSTMVWKRVLMRKRKKIPINILQSILVLLLQTMAIICIALSLAEPHLFDEDVLLMNSEHIIIIDASASMIASPQGEQSRFEKAKALIRDEMDEIFKDDMGTVSLIYADYEPRYILNDYSRDRRGEANDKVNTLECSYGGSDIQEALRMAEEELNANPYAKITLYTDTEYGNMGTAVTVRNLADKSEWNVAILGCDSSIRDNEYIFDITVASYGNVALKLDMNVEIKGALLPGEKQPKDYTLTVPLTIESDSVDLSSVQTVTVCATDADFGGKDEWYYESYEEANISFELDDSIPDDNSFTVYGGKRDEIYVQYWSGAPNIFWQFGFATMTNNLYQNRIITYSEVYTESGQVAVNEGYDIYVFEHGIPDIGEMPKDGIVVLSDPGSAAARVGLSVGSKVTNSVAKGLNSEATHPLLNYIDVSNIVVTQYTRLYADDDPTFLPIMYCGDDPVAFVKNTPEQKIVVLGFSINMSSFYETEFQIFLYNLVNYFMPITLPGYECSVGDSMKINCKGVGMTVENIEAEISEILSLFPTEYKFVERGTYTFTTKFALVKKDEVRKVYVHTPPAESELFAVSDFRFVLDNRELTGEVGTDIFLYIAIALLVLMLVEWCLQFKEII